MSPAEVQRLEGSLGVSLPLAYRQALQNNQLPGRWIDHPEFITVAAMLGEENKHFRMNPEDQSELRAPGIVGAIKFFLFYGSRRRILEKRREWFATWVEAGRFVVGSDLAEERYFIVLTEAFPKVYRYELETRRASVAAWQRGSGVDSGMASRSQEYANTYRK
jgi:hypothetical protein